MYKRAVVAFIVLSACATIATVVAVPSNRRAFSQELWKEARDTSSPSNTENPRASMVDDLLKNHLKVGMTKEQVLALLGPPEQDRQESLWYHIGSYRRRRILSGSDQLVVGFDKEGLVTIARVASD